MIGACFGFIAYARLVRYLRKWADQTFGANRAPKERSGLLSAVQRRQTRGLFPPIRRQGLRSSLFRIVFAWDAAGDRLDRAGSEGA